MGIGHKGNAAEIRAVWDCRHGSKIDDEDEDDYSDKDEGEFRGGATFRSTNVGKASSPYFRNLRNRRGARRGRLAYIRRAKCRAVPS
jgi:hypothetical protein